MSDSEAFPILEHDPRRLIADLLARDRRVLLYGEPGSGKSTLAKMLACELGRAGRRVSCISADPGIPAFGPPGALCRAEWDGAHWRITALEALCSLDAARFRMPLAAAVRRLASGALDGTLLIDAPGVVRGVAGAELLAGLSETTAADLILVLARNGAVPLRDELAAAGVDVVVVAAEAGAHRPGRQSRAEARTALWKAWMADAEERRLPLAGLRCLGTPPPATAPHAWAGRQAALLDDARSAVLGEIVAREADRLRIRLPRGSAPTTTLLVRDAIRDADGWLVTAQQHRPVPVGDNGPLVRGHGSPPVVRVGSATATLVNGIFGDPLLHLRLDHRKRSLLFDMGDGSRLPGRLAHQISDVFISHAHFDHIGGFLWLLRSRIGEFPPCRLYGPPGLADHIEGLVRGIHWDRVGARAPRFEVAELHGDTLQGFAVRAGRAGPQPLHEVPVTAGILRDEPDLRVRAVTLDHGIPVLAFAFEQPRQYKVRKERLQARGLAPGPWLGELKRRLADGEPDASIRLPDGRSEPVAVLAKAFVLIAAGETLVYATDLADQPVNRKKLVDLARGADTLICEAGFVTADAEQAARTGHLTASACGEIAAAAGVTRLLPFHFSRRYESAPARVYAEVRAASGRVPVLRY